MLDPVMTNLISLLMAEVALLGNDKLSQGEPVQRRSSEARVAARRGDPCSPGLLLLRGSSQPVALPVLSPGFPLCSRQFLPPLLPFPEIQPTSLFA